MLAITLLLSTALGTMPTEPPVPPSPARQVVTFEGTCDASGAVELSDGRFLLGDDENNVLRVYDGHKGGAPLQTFDVSAALGLPPGKKQTPETDIEAATSLPPLAFWLTSHGRKSSGKEDANRVRFFATRQSEDGKSLQIEGKPYTRLLDDLLAAPQLKGYGLDAAARLAPKQDGGFNLEGMTVMEDGKSFLIGFRNPRPEGKALAVTLLNPAEMVKGEPARLGPAVLLDLGGQGIRSMSRWRGRYLIIGGSPSGNDGSRLFVWNGKAEKPTPVEGADFTGLNPEAFVSYESEDRILVLSDDGTQVLDELECKRLKDPARKRFRGVWVSPTDKR
ncbi:DUF3616 domain-containing protein [Melittangium boletus]|uniref:DUF3616 domain-containing protein n=1 Tax=Melittangium boletus DSM 14713 TaxID=1294270 RepID=A0A250I6H8_9BACT|nr:DUF3616 domain-containing protein [Melittangium boletus]ATB26772.1 hypothetical protein MEBOL_000206 [Melittangium boletus DSM 14713]